MDAPGLGSVPTVSTDMGRCCWPGAKNAPAAGGQAHGTKEVAAGSHTGNFVVGLTGANHWRVRKNRLASLCGYDLLTSKAAGIGGNVSATLHVVKSGDVSKVTGTPAGRVMLTRTSFPTS